MPRTRNQIKKKRTYSDTSDDSDSSYIKISLKRSNKNRKPKVVKESSDDSDSDFSEDTFNQVRKDRKIKGKQTKSKLLSKKKVSGIVRCFSDSDIEDIAPNIQKAHKQDIERKIDTFFKQFNSDENDDSFKSSEISKVDHKKHCTIKKYENLYILPSDTEPELDVKPSTSTSKETKNVENNSAKEIKTTNKTENLFGFVDDILNRSDINGSIDKMKENICKTSFEDIMKKTNEILSNVSTLIGDFSTKSKESEDKSVEKEGPTCPVCLETLTGESKVMVTVCGHMFCEGCILQIVKTVKKCPTCRKSVTSKKYHPIYL